MERYFLSQILAIAILYSPVSGHVLAQKSLSSILDDIFSPANTERALQMINVAGTTANRHVPEIARYASTDYGPARTITGDIARNGILPVGEPRYIADGGRYYEKACSGQAVKANWIDLNFPKEIYQLPVSVQESGRNTYLQPSPYYPATEPYFATPTPCVASPNPYSPVSNQYSPVPSQYLPVSSPYLPGSSPYLPASSPYLPATSPLSMSPYMPPPTQSKGQFLRKIPIPPPTL